MTARQTSAFTLACLLAMAATACNQRPQASDSGATPASASAPATTENSSVAAQPAPAPDPLEVVLANDVRAVTASEGATAPTVTTACSLDGVDQNNGGAIAQLKKTQTHVIRGWFVNQTTHQGVGTFRVVLKGSNGSFEFDARTRVDRPDVASYLKTPNLKNAGYNVQVALDKVPAGSYEVELVSTGTPAYTCMTSSTFELQD